MTQITASRAACSLIKLEIPSFISRALLKIFRYINASGARMNETTANHIANVIRNCYSGQHLENVRKGVGIEITQGEDLFML